MSGNKNEINLDVSDGTVMSAYIASPSDTTKTYPGLILIQEAGGVNKQIRRVADRLANEGYIVIAPALFHRSSNPAFEIEEANMELIMPHASVLTEEGLTDDIKASWDWLQNNSQVQAGNIGCIGFCMGGRTAFLANTILPFKAAVAYYGGGIAPDLLKKTPLLNADMLFFWGGKDDYIPMEQVDQINDSLKQANKEYTNVVFSYAGHAFFRDGNESYNERAAKESWPITLAYLKNRLGNN